MNIHCNLKQLGKSRYFQGIVFVTPKTRNNFVFP